MTARIAKKAVPTGRADPGLPGLRPPRIKSLTAGQQADLPRDREHWRGIGLSTRPADFERAKTAIRA